MKRKKLDIWMHYSFFMCGQGYRSILVQAMTNHSWDLAGPWSLEDEDVYRELGLRLVWEAP
jgi:hypothetical protein